jgi:hypothetical protein
MAPGAAVDMPVTVVMVVVMMTVPVTMMVVMTMTAVTMATVTVAAVVAMTAMTAAVTATAMTATVVLTCIGSGRDERRKADNCGRDESEECRTFEHCQRPLARCEPSGTLVGGLAPQVQPIDFR